MKNGKTNNKITLQPKGPIKIQNIKLIIIPIGYSDALIRHVK